MRRNQVIGRRYGASLDEIAQAVDDKPLPDELESAGDGVSADLARKAARDVLEEAETR